MNSYRLEDIDPPLNETELLLLDVVGKLWMASAKHQFDDPNSPQLSEFTNGEYASFDELKAATKEWFDAVMRYRIEHLPKPKPRASLEELWDGIQTRRPLTPNRRAGDDLFFETFGISQRFVDEPRSPSGNWGRWYFVGYPTASESFRCVANEASNRKFITASRLSRCEPPGEQEFLAISVSTIRTNFVTKEERPMVMQLYLPSKFGAWQMVKTDRNQHEAIV